MKLPSVGVSVDGEVAYHVPGVVGDYATLCGLDSNDPSIGQYAAPTPKGQKVNCTECETIWRSLKQLCVRESDFE